MRAGAGKWVKEVKSVKRGRGSGCGSRHTVTSRMKIGRFWGPTRHITRHKGSQHPSQLGFGVRGPQSRVRSRTAAARGATAVKGWWGQHSRGEQGKELRCLPLLQVIPIGSARFEAALSPIPDSAYARRPCADPGRLKEH